MKKQPENSPPLRVVLVEDNEHDILTFERALQKSEVSAEITVFTRGEEALQKLRDHTAGYEILVTDFKLPGMTGLDLCMALLRDNIMIPKIILTGAGTEDLAVEALKAGVDDYIIKDPARRYLNLLGVVLPAVVRQYEDRLYRERMEKELHRVNEELERFVAVAAHDLKAPLRRIYQFTQLLIKKSTLTMDNDAGQYLNFIYRSSERMMALIESLQVHTHLGALNVKVEPVDLKRIVDEVREDLALEIEEKQATITVENLPVIDGDRIQLQQLFQNLLANALKFSKKNEPPAIRITATLRTEEVQIHVKDNGLGFDSQYNEDIFEAFRRLHAEDQYTGSGIGLSTCRKIVERHNGRITARGEPGVGATFIVELPLKQKNLRNKISERRDPPLATNGQPSLPGGHL